MDNDDEEVDMNIDLTGVIVSGFIGFFWVCIVTVIRKFEVGDSLFKALLYAFSSLFWGPPWIAGHILKFLLRCILECVWKDILRCPEYGCESSYCLYTFWKPIKNLLQVYISATTVFIISIFSFLICIEGITHGEDC
ncbi:hypothetical protein BDA99DRAFT_514314 [Phascolomyces articulosus]|uniref:Transmembrane protein n=1 Tax=Phascolomyces articulosus TaxID=60185 RepID=A0AAD5PCA1_9FUNG|nr:hypothetical protein BDA99DRAFT_514314 [Phascolomyces articulosus]